MSGILNFSSVVFTPKREGFRNYTAIYKKKSGLVFRKTVKARSLAEAKLRSIRKYKKLNLLQVI